MPFNLFQKQKTIIERCDARINLLEGSVSSGKTHGSYEWWARYLLYNAPKGDLLMTGKTLKALERNVLLPLQDYIPVNYSLHKKQANILGKRVHLEGANDAQSEGKIRGMTIAGHYGDEVTLWPENYFKQSLARMRVEGAKFIGTTNPDSPNHWLKKDWVDADKGVKAAKLLIDDNPHLPTDYVESIKKEYTGLWYRRYILGEWCLAEGLVYDMFDPDIHVVTDLPKMKRHFIGVDYGTGNPTVFLLIGQGVDDRFYVMREYFHSGADGRQKTDSEYAKELKRFLPNHYENICIDPSAKSFILACKRINIDNIRKARNDVLDGIRSVSSLLSAGLLYYHKSCTNLINEKQAYSWDSKAQEKGEDKPIKANDHACDAERYSLFSNIKYWKSILDYETEAVDRLEGAIVN